MVDLIISIYEEPEGGEVWMSIGDGQNTIFSSDFNNEINLDVHPYLQERLVDMHYGPCNTTRAPYDYSIMDELPRFVEDVKEYLENNTNILIQGRVVVCILGRILYF